MAEKVIPLSRIVIDRGTQSRVEVDEDTVDRYAEAMQREEVFPPMLVYYDKSTDEYILADGFHRYHALCKVRPGTDVTVDRRFGTAMDALWVSIGANKSHGLPRTGEDKRKAIRLALTHPKGTEMSDRKVGRYVGVSHRTVASVRQELESGGQIVHLKERKGLDGKTYPVVGKPSNSEPIGECGSCDFYNGRTCTLDEEVHEPWADGCEDYAKKLENTPTMPPPPPADTENVRTIETPDKNPKRMINPHSYRKLKGRVTVHLPLDDMQMFAIELRNHVDAEYLGGCIKIIAHLLADEEIAE